MRRPTLLAALLAAPMAAPASAQDAAADRAEMDLVAGRVLFQNSPLYDRVVEVRLPAAQAAAAIAPAPVAAGGRRPVRVVLPSPYAAR